MSGTPGHVSRRTSWPSAGALPARRRGARRPKSARNGSCRGAPRRTSTAASHSSSGSTQLVSRFASRSALRSTAPGARADRPDADEGLVDQQLLVPVGGAARRAERRGQPSQRARARAHSSAMPASAPIRARTSRAALGVVRRRRRAAFCGNRAARARRSGVEVVDREGEPARDRRRPRSARAGGRSGRTRCPRRPSPSRRPVVCWKRVTNSSARAPRAGARGAGPRAARQPCASASVTPAAAGST